MKSWGFCELKVKESGKERDKEVRTKKKEREGKRGRKRLFQSQKRVIIS